MSGALQELVIDGIATNIPLQIKLIEDPAMHQKPCDIHYLERKHLI